MQIKNLAIAASVSAIASAAPSTGSSKTFGLVAIHSGSAVQYAAFNAAQSSLFAGLPNQGASCARPKEQQATFYINDGALYLYDKSATPQEIYVDRSGMGMLSFLSLHTIPSSKSLIDIQARARSDTPPVLSPPPRTASARAGPRRMATSSSMEAI
jgi:hypothetical protein